MVTKDTLLEVTLEHGYNRSLPLGPQTAALSPETIRAASAPVRRTIVRTRSIRPLRVLSDYPPCNRP